MATVSISEAARLAGVSRQHIYKLADAGKISVQKELVPGKSGDNPKDYRQLIEVSELVRVFGSLSPNESSAALLANRSGNVHDSSLLEEKLKVIADLLSDREAQLRDAKEREEWLRKQVEELTGTVKLIGHTKESMDGSRAIELEKKLVELKKIGQGHIDVLQARLRKERNRGFWERLFNTRAN